MEACENCGRQIGYGLEDRGRCERPTMDSSDITPYAYEVALACERRAKERALAEVARRDAEIATLRDALDLAEQCAVHALGGPAPLLNGIAAGSVGKLCREHARLRAKLDRVREACEPEPMPSPTFGATIRAQRMAVRMTLHACSAALGVPVPYLSRMERGKEHPSPSQLNELAALFGIPAELLAERLDIPVWERVATERGNQLRAEILALLGET